jgi:mycoredoxin
MSQPEQIVMYGTTWCGDCRRSRRWLTENQIPFTEIDIDQDESAAAYVRSVNDGNQVVPTIVFPDGSRLTEPSNMELALLVAQVLHITTPDAERAQA